MRSGSVFRRCGQCSKRAGLRRCPHCGSESLSWAYQVDVNLPGERRRQRQRSGFATKAEALAAMHTMQGDATEGLQEPSRMTLARYLAEWHASIRGRVRGGTWAEYESAIRRHLVPHLGDVPLRHLSRARVRAFYQQLEERGGVRGRPLSPKTVHNTHLVLRAALGAAVEDGLLRANPADRAHRVASARREMRTWTTAQVRAFLDHVATAPEGPGLSPRERYRYGLDRRGLVMWRLFATTGMRRGEVLGLRWEDVDLEGRAVRVQRSRSRGEHGMEYGAPKTAKGRRRITIDRVTADLLRGHREAQQADRDLFGSGYLDGDLVFARADGSPHHPDGITGAFVRLSRQAGLPPIRLHDLRHSHATHALEAGVHPRVVQERLGHASIQMTLDTYSHSVPAMDVLAADRIAALVDAAG